MNRLALRVDAIAGECAASLASRLGMVNGEDRLRSFCTHMGLPIKQLRMGDVGFLVRLSRLADVDLNALRAWTPKQNEAGYFDLGAERIKFSAFTRTTMMPSISRPHYSRMWQVPCSRTQRLSHQWIMTPC